MSAGLEGTCNTLLKLRKNTEFNSGRAPRKQHSRLRPVIQQHRLHSHRKLVSVGGTGTLGWGQHWRSEQGIAYVLHSGATGIHLVQIQHLNSFHLNRFPQPTFQEVRKTKSGSVRRTTLAKATLALIRFLFSVGGFNTRVQSVTVEVCYGYQC